MMATCSRCPSPIAQRSKSGLCRKCAQAAVRCDPEKEGRRLAALRIALASPEARENKRLARQRVEEERRDDPNWKAYKRASGRRLRAQYDADPVAQAKNLAARPIAGRKARATRMAWCPAEYLDDARRLRRKGLLASQVRTLIEEQIARDRAEFMRSGRLPQSARLERDRINHEGACQ